MHYNLKFLPFIALFFFFHACLDFFRYSEAKEPPPLSDYQTWEMAISESFEKHALTFSDRKLKDIHAIVLHSSETRKLDEYMKLTISNGFSVHAIVTESGKIIYDPKYLTKVFVAAPGIDEAAIHVGYEGSATSLAKNPEQKRNLVKLIDFLQKKFKIPASNYAIAGKKGIFSHNQAKRRFGGFADFTPCGNEKVVSLVLTEINGKFFEEENWKNRFEGGWVLKKENRQKIQESFKPTNGREISVPEKSVLNNVEKNSDGLPVETHRVKYVHRGKIKPSCVVLHFTAIPDYMESLRILESRGLTATLMVDKNGLAYQLLDSLEDRASAAAGTNENCIQVEIVAKDTAELLKQKEQIEKVKKLVIELSQLYKFSLQNEDITAFSGVYSHTQAKKKWGGSIFLNAKDFDPGEEYMELILTETGGVYFKEEKWKNRLEWNWAILFKDFQP